LLPAQGFDAVRAPSGIEFTFGNAVSGGETHQGGTNESAAESNAEKDQHPPDPETKQIRGCIGRSHFYPRRKRIASFAT
jgi:hypothetical protein